MTKLNLCLALVAVLLCRAAVAKDGYFDSDGVRIHYTDEGAGPPVVLIHGYTASGDMNWRIPGVINGLVKDYRVITIDNRGHGRSDKPTDAAAYGANMAADVVRLLDHLQIDKAHLAGYSMGGMISLKLCATAPDRVRSAVIGGMGWLQPGPIIEQRLPDAEDEGKAALRACARAFPQLGITREELLAIKTPLIVVVGSNDDLLERRVKPLLEARPDIPLVEVTGANHITCVFRKEWRDAIRQFLDEQTSGKKESPRPAGTEK